MSASLAANWVPHLLIWADARQPEAARQTRAVAHRPETQARYLARLDQLWWAWAARIWAGWPPERRRAHDARLADLAKRGLSPRGAERQAFLELTEGRIAA